MPLGGPLSERALILAPFGRDAQIATLILNEAGHATFVCNSIDELGREIVSGAGFAIVALEAFAVPDLAPIADAIDRQEPWSDFPFLILATHGQGLERKLIPEHLMNVLGNVTIVERL